ncbi:MAG: phage tail assembly chaperone [Hyphomonas sp.]
MLPWGEMLRAAAALGLMPEWFWRLSLREWRWLNTPSSSFSRGDLERLMQNHPDTSDKHGRDNDRV